MVSAHGAITSIAGLNGVQGRAMGIKDSVPRTGSRARPFQGDTSIIRDGAIRSGQTGACGRTRLDGNLDMTKATDDIMSLNGGQLPSVARGKDVTMSLHQINQDGAGPFRCDWSSDGTTFTQMTVTRNVPGFLGLSPVRATTMPLTVRVADNAPPCTAGSNGKTCVIRCRNSAIAGPFGGCVPVVMEGDASAAAAAGGDNAVEQPQTASAAATAAAARVDAAAGRQRRNRRENRARSNGASDGAATPAPAPAAGGGAGGLLQGLLGGLLKRQITLPAIGPLPQVTLPPPPPLPPLPPLPKVTIGPGAVPPAGVNSTLTPSVTPPPALPGINATMTLAPTGGPLGVNATATNTTTTPPPRATASSAGTRRTALRLAFEAQLANVHSPAQAAKLKVPDEEE